MTDLIVRLLREGYDAVARERATHLGDPDDFEARMLGRRAVVVRSEAGARAFYDESLVSREGAVPPPLAWLLFGRGALHGLDGPRHRDRKRLLLDVVEADRLDPLLAEVEVELRQRPVSQEGVFDTLVTAYGVAVLRWAGLVLGDREARGVSRQLAAIVDGFGFAGLKAALDAGFGAAGAAPRVDDGTIEGAHRTSGGDFGGTG